MAFHLGLHCLPKYLFTDNISIVKKVNAYAGHTVCLLCKWKDVHACLKGHLTHARYLAPGHENIYSGNRDALYQYFQEWGGDILIGVKEHIMKSVHNHLLHHCSGKKSHPIKGYACPQPGCPTPKQAENSWNCVGR